MPINGYSVGRDVTLDIIGPRGALAFNLITGFDAKPDTNDVKVKRLDGITDHVIFPDGWTGSFEIERQDSALDDYFAQLEAGFFSGINQAAVSITETITEVSGAVSQYRFVGVVLKLSEAGAWKGDATIKQTLAFLASRRIKVA